MTSLPATRGYLCRAGRTPLALPRAGRVSRIFIAEAPGFFKKDLTVEDVRDNWDTIRGEADYLIPTSVNDEFARLLMPALSDE